MEQRNKEQNNEIFKVSELLTKMTNAVKYLINHNIEPNQFDIDLLMTNTRKLYDTLCTFDFEQKDFVVKDEEGDEDFSDKVIGDEGEEVTDEDNEVIEDEDDFGDEEDEVIEDESDEVDTDSDEIDEDYDDEDISDEDEEYENEKHNDDLIVSFEVEETENKEDIEEVNDEEDEEEEDNNAYSEVKETSDSGIRAFTRTSHTELHTLGDKLEMTEDNSLAARLQRKAISDLVTAIEINDKFLLLNELFGGSMEKYNKSIRALNNFSTLLGAKTYMGELQIEYQWDIDSDAYKKLNDLVERRFC